jgi:hypothetical protein
LKTLPGFDRQVAAESGKRLQIAASDFDHSGVG